MNPEEAIDRLVRSEAPHIIGVRHHSPALAAAMPALLEAARPELIAVELPPEAAPLVEWLTHPESRAPLALAFNARGGLSFYPFADFSPELAALRWAREHDVEVACIDLSLGIAMPDDAGDAGDQTLLAALHRRARSTDSQELWDRLVEAPAPGSTPEQIRRAAIAHGWAVRQTITEQDPRTLAREAAMRRGIAAATGRVTAVVGAFHVPALVTSASEPTLPDPVPVDGCIVPYSFAQLDARSGYPAGIRDPGWQQAVWEARLVPDAVAAALTRHVSSVARELRADDHPAGPREAAEAARMALDLATIRGLSAPSRRELVEAATSVYAQGEVLGRGRAVAKALERVLVGDRRGRVADGAPQSPLRASIVHELEGLRLPTSGERELRLTPLRGGNDLARHVLLRRLVVGGIRYARAEAQHEHRGADTIGVIWHASWNTETDATIELAAVRGLTAQQVATTALLTSDHPDAVSFLVDAADAAVPEAGRVALDQIAGLVATFDFAGAVGAARALDDVAAARVPGAALLDESLRREAGALGDECSAAAVREIPGIAGSDDPAQAVALAAFAADARERSFSVGHHLRTLAERGSPLMQGAATGVLVRDDDSFGDVITSWLHAVTPDTRRALARRLAGLLTTAAPLLTSSDSLGMLLDTVGAIDDAHFVQILPALRGGFDVLSPDARAAIMADLSARYGSVGRLALPADDAVAAATYDQAARERLAALGLADVAFSPAERWRLVLAEDRDGLSGAGRRFASALDELYGGPSQGSIDAQRRGAGSGPSQVGVREWRGEIEALFGEEHVQEIFAAAIARGRADTLDHLDPDAVRPSTELLSTALSLAGALPEARLAKLRPLVRRMVRELTEQLAIRVRPALTGITSARPTRRDTGILDLDRTIRTNLRHVVEIDGRAQIVPVTPIFRSRVAKAADWHLFVVVDVSGSMSTSVVHSALLASIIAGVPAVEVTFLAFSTEVIDFSDHLDDPLALLLEVSIGGGTNIALAVRTVRSRVRVPNRSLVVVISDFEEYGSGDELLAEVTALVTSGVRTLGCAALDDDGEAVYNVGMAERLAGAGMRVAALTPLQLARWVGEVVRS